MFNRKDIEDNLPQIKISEVAHYTRISTLSYLIPDGSTSWSSAWATPVQFLNDRLELALGLDILDNVASSYSKPNSYVQSAIWRFKNTGGHNLTDAYQMSFSSNIDDLAQWRGYGNNGMGCSIVTDTANMIDTTRNTIVSDVAGWVIYNPYQQKIFAKKVLKSLHHIRDISHIEKLIISAACFMKHHGFASEKEFRLLKYPTESEIKFRESGDRIVPYTDFLNGVKELEIKRIIIGPGWQLSNLVQSDFNRNHVVQGIHRLLTARKLQNIPIEPSAIPYDPK